MNRNVKIAKELVRLAREMVAGNITKEDIQKAWKTPDYLWKEFIKKHNDLTCYIEGKGTKLETYNCLPNKGNIPKVIIHRNGVYKVMGCGTDEPEFYRFAEALQCVEKSL